MNRLPAVLTAWEIVLSGRIKLLQTIRGEALVVAVLDDLVGVHDDRDEQGEDNVDEEADEEVEVDSAVNPDWQCPLHRNWVESGKHVVPVDQTEEALAGAHQSGELEVVRTKNHPSSKGESNVEKRGTDEKTKHVWRCSLHCEDQDVVSLEEAEVSEKTKPHQKVASAKHEAADIPHVADDGLW